MLYQVVHLGGGNCVLGCGAGDRTLLRCRGNREVQETSICGAFGFKSHREVLFCKDSLCVHVPLCWLLCTILFLSLFCRYNPGKRRLLRRNEVPLVVSVELIFVCPEIVLVLLFLSTFGSRVSCFY